MVTGHLRLLVSRLCGNVVFASSCLNALTPRGRPRGSRDRLTVEPRLKLAEERYGFGHHEPKDNRDGRRAYEKDKPVGHR